MQAVTSVVSAGKFYRLSPDKENTARCLLNGKISLVWQQRYVDFAAGNSTLSLVKQQNPFLYQQTPSLCQSLVKHFSLVEKLLWGWMFKSEGWIAASGIHKYRSYPGWSGVQLKLEKLLWLNCPPPLWLPQNNTVSASFFAAWKTPGAHFCKVLTIVNGPWKLLSFTFKSEVSIVFQITW